MRKIFVVTVFSLIYLQGSSQNRLDVDISLRDSSQDRSVIEIIIRNLTPKSHVIGLQNWQVISIPTNVSGVVGIPLKASLLNFIFVTDNPNWSSDRLYPLDWEIDFDSIPEESLKILAPTESIVISLVVGDSSLRRFEENKEKVEVTYVFSVADRKRTKRYLKEEHSEVFLKSGNLLVSNVEVNHKYLEKPSVSSIRFYNMTAPRAKIDFSKIGRMFSMQVFSKELSFK